MKRKTRRMNVYLILPTSHMDELQLLKTKKALKDFTTQPVIQTGLEFWIEEPNATVGTITGIAVLTTRKNHVTTLLNLCASSRLSPHIACTPEAPPAKYFCAIDAYQANEWLVKHENAGVH